MTNAISQDVVKAEILWRLEEGDRFRAINKELVTALIAAEELWAYLPFDSGADVQEVATRVRMKQDAALEFARVSQEKTA